MVTAGENKGRGERFEATADQADRRLDRVLRGLFGDVPLGAIMRAIRKGQVRVNGERTTGNERLSEGDVVDVPWEAGMTRECAEPAGGEARTPPLTLYRDADVWCVEKEAGLLSQPDRRGADSLITRVWAELSWVRRDFRPALLHRLDRNVSGVVVVALNAPVLRTLSRLLREGQIRKIYRALVVGRTPALGEISFSLSKNEQDNLVAVDESGKEALTRFRRIAGGDRTTLVELELVTGRSHQARVHMASIGHPIIGDAKYGRGNRQTDAGRLMLHAYSVAFPLDEALPERLRGLSVESPIPSVFNRFSFLSEN